LENSLRETVIFDWTTEGGFGLNYLWRDATGRRFLFGWFIGFVGFGFFGFFDLNGFF